MIVGGSHWGEGGGGTGWGVGVGGNFNFRTFVPALSVFKGERAWDQEP